MALQPVMPSTHEGKRTPEGCNVLSHKASSCRDLNANQDTYLAFILPVHPTRIACVFAPGFGIFVSTGQLGHGATIALTLRAVLVPLLYGTA